MQNTVAAAEMTLASLMKNYALYNYWANKTLVGWLRTKPAEKMDIEVASSFSSIRKTLIHIWNTEKYWLSVFSETPAPAPLTPENTGSLEDVFEGILAQSKELADYVNSLTEDAVKEACKLDSPWVKGVLPRGEFIQHTFNHSTYHRGQIVTIGRHVDLTDAPMTDYNFYNLIGKKQQ